MTELKDLLKTKDAAELRTKPVVKN
jgi:hypothetical protein